MRNFGLRVILSKISRVFAYFQCEQVEEFYRARGKLLEFDLPGGIPESWPKLLRALHVEDLENK